MGSEDLSIEEFEIDVLGRNVNLALCTDNVNSILAPIRYDMEFVVENISNNSSTIKLSNKYGWIELCQINKIYRNQNAEIKQYILNCGKIPQRDMEFVITLL